MRPVFNEFIEFLEHHNYRDNENSIKLTEGKYWINRNIVKAIDETNGDLIKIMRLYPKYVGEDIEVTFKFYNDSKELDIDNFETWDLTVERNSDRILLLEKEAIDMITKYTKIPNQENIVLTSGGKDSQVLMHLARKVQSNMLGLFGNTSLDCADTYRQMNTIDNLIKVNPKEGFYQWQKRLQYIPTRFARACCEIFKEGSMIEYLDQSDKYKDSKILFLMGMRNSESTGRSGYQDEWKNNKWDKRDWLAILPIRKWTEDDIWLYILKENIEFNVKYRKGYARVGCSVVCPFSVPSTWMLDVYWYENMYDRWHKILEKDFIDNKKWTRLNCTKSEYHSIWNGGKMRDYPTEEVIDELMEYKGLTDRSVATKMFNNKCSFDGCNKNVVDNNLVAMNMKLFGRNTTKMYCKKHLKIEMNMTNKEYNATVDRFKDNCNLF